MRTFIPVPAELRSNPALAAAHRAVITAARIYEHTAEYGIYTGPALHDLEQACAALAIAQAAQPPATTGQPRPIPAPQPLRPFQQLDADQRTAVLTRLAGAA